MTSAKLNKKMITKKQGAMITAAKPKLLTKPRTRIKKELNDFLALHIGDAIDAYLRGLAMSQKK